MQQIATLLTAADLARFYLTELPANGFTIVPGANNAVVDVSEVGEVGEEAGYQLFFITPDNNAGQIIISPQPLFGESDAYIEILTKASNY